MAVELHPDLKIVDVLRGEISDPIQTISNKPGSEGQLVIVRLALQGPGMFGLTDWKDNKEWSGIFSHCVLSARYATYFAVRMIKAGHNINPDLILNGMIVSHLGRRQWDEAIWYPEAAPDAQAKRAMTNETLGLHLIQGKVPDNIFQFVAALGLSDEFPVGEEVYSSWEYRLSILADHRTSDRYLPLHIRMGDFIWVNFFNKNQVEPATRGQVHNSLSEFFQRQRNYHLGVTGGRDVTVDEIAEEMQNLGASPTSARSTLSLQLENLLKDVGTEAELIMAGIDPDEVNEETVPMPKWEEDLRRQYVTAAEESIVGRIHYWQGLISQDWLTDMGMNVPRFREYRDLEFPDNTWWGQSARGIFE